MTDTSNAPLSFDPAGPPARTICSICQQPIGDSYFTLGTQLACERCKSQVELAGVQRRGPSAVAKAVVFGSLWGLLGAAVWWGVRVAAGYEVGLIAIAIGYFVGRAVFAASGHRGGAGFQALAVALTYFWICANYVPDIVKELASMPDQELAQSEDPGAADAEAAGAPVSAETAGAQGSDAGASEPPGALAFAILPVFVFGIAMAAPFLQGAENVIGLLIIGFGLYQAWKMNRRTELAIAGPFRVGAVGGASG
jgi:hypothetical protein